MLSAILPTDEPDPVERVRRVHDSMASSKEIFQALPAERLTDFAEFPPPAVFARAMRLSARLRLGSRLTPGNLVISNVPGPREPLYAAGARLEHYYIDALLDDILAAIDTLGKQPEPRRHLRGGGAGPGPRSRRGRTTAQADGGSNFADVVGLRVRLA